MNCPRCGQPVENHFYVDGNEECPYLPTEALRLAQRKAAAALFRSFVRSAGESDVRFAYIDGLREGCAALCFECGILAPGETAATLLAEWIEAAK